MGTQLRGTSCCLGGVCERRLGIRDRLRVVRHPGVINRQPARDPVAERSEDLPVNRDTPEGRHPLRDR
jgi:hypothetical protein